MLEKLSADPFLRSQNGASSGSVALFLLYVKVIAIEIYWNQAVEQIELI